MYRSLRRVRRYFRALGVRLGLLAVMREMVGRNATISVRGHGLAFPVFMRTGSSDIDVFWQVLIEREYAFPTLLPDDASFIIDAGANVGYSAAFFATRYPDACVFAVEPDPSNYELLLTNCLPYPGIHAVMGALGGASGQVEVIRTDQGEWASRTWAATASEGQGSNLEDASMSATAGQCVRAYTVGELLRESGSARVDILKVDIEGAELDVFEQAEEFIDEVDVVLIELHDRLRPGCARAFWQATVELPRVDARGELVGVAR